MSNTIYILLVALAAIVIFGFSITFAMMVWDECRSGGHSFLYCLYLISRK